MTQTTYELKLPSFSIESDFDAKEILKSIERYGRTCYKSEHRITEDSANKFVKMLINRGHESVLEHVSVTVRFTCDRGVSHELVRHRLGAYSQESTRYVSYQKRGIEFITPPFFEPYTKKFDIWLEAMKSSAEAYRKLIELGAKPEEARSVLPNSLKTEIVVTYNLRQWRHFFRERALNRGAHPQMRELTLPLLKNFKTLLPSIFFDLEEEDS